MGYYKVYYDTRIYYVVFKLRQAYKPWSFSISLWLKHLNSSL